MSFEKLKAGLSRTGPVRVAVAAAEGEEVFQALRDACDQGLCTPVLVGNEEKSRAQAQRAGLKEFEAVAAGSPQEAAELAVLWVREGRAELIMKGQLSTSTLIKAVLKDKGGVHPGGLLSHLAVFETPGGRLLGLTDSGLNIAPNLEQKLQILRNAVGFFHLLGFEEPRVAVLSAVEVVNPEMPSTLDAALLAQMGERKQIQGAAVDGPLSLDLALSPEACRLKGVGGPVAGKADILLAPDLESGNILGKALVLLARFPAGGIVVGALCPIVLLSRCDSARERLNSLILGVFHVHHLRH